MWAEMDMALALTCVAARSLTGLPIEHIEARLAPCWAVHNADDPNYWRYIIATCTRLTATIEGITFQFAEYEGSTIAERLLDDLPYAPDAVEWAYNCVLLEREREAS